MDEQMGALADVVTNALRALLFRGGRMRVDALAREVGFEDAEVASGFFALAEESGFWVLLGGVVILTQRGWSAFPPAS